MIQKLSKNSPSILDHDGIMSHFKIKPVSIILKYACLKLIFEEEKFFQQEIVKYFSEKVQLIKNYYKITP